MSLLDEHVALFNAGVRSGDFAPMLENFADDARMAFERAGALRRCAPASCG